jgi:hypothetical protein
MWFELVLAILAVWRLAHLVSKEDGPFDIFGKLKERAGATFDVVSQEWQGNTELGYLLTCPLCLSIWFAVPAAIWITSVGMYTFVTWLAVSGGACILEMGLTKNVR